MWRHLAEFSFSPSTLYLTGVHIQCSRTTVMPGFLSYHPGNFLYQAEWKCWLPGSTESPGWIMAFDDWVWMPNLVPVLSIALKMEHHQTWSECCLTNLTIYQNPAVSISHLAHQILHSSQSLKMFQGHEIQLWKNKEHMCYTPPSLLYSK